MKLTSRRPLLALLLASLLLSACLPDLAAGSSFTQVTEPQTGVQLVADSGQPADSTTAWTERPLYQPGELVDYVAQTGDSLPALAVHFNTTVEEILEANPFIPPDATTMPPGMPMRIPIYYVPLWGSPYQILPDSQFINGPAHLDFDTGAFISQHPGWLKEYTGFVSGANRSGAQIIELVATNYSVSPRLLLALLEFQSGALSQPSAPPQTLAYTLGYIDYKYRGVYLQLAWAANLLNNAYYGWRLGNLTIIEHPNGRLERPDPWQNAASVSLQYYFSSFMDHEAYLNAIGSDGFSLVFSSLFGDPWQADQPHIPGSLVQPEFKLPFHPGKVWALTGGPHTGWGRGEPLAALDFAPGAVTGGCTPTTEPATAVASGVIVRSETGVVVLDLDGDGDERTGWTVFYLHIASEGRAPLGARLETGDPLGLPSCEGGESTGTHIHIARKYNGEWVAADGVLPFNLEGWIAKNGSRPYLGSLTRFSQIVTACECSDAASFIQAGSR